MSFVAMPVAVVALGALAIAGLLYLLQRLRTRRRTVFLPTAALWKEAARSAPLRVLGPRFRYWLAYLLMLCIALSLWLAAAHPVVTPDPRSGGQLFYLDLSAGLGDEAVAARARRALLADVRATPAEGRTVYLGDATGTVLLAPGESASLLAARLDGLVPAARPSTFAHWIAGIGARTPQADRTTVRYYGTWPDARAARAVLPASIHLAYGFLADPVQANRGIVALGATPAASGQWSKADILIALAAPADGTIGPDALRWSLDGAAVVPPRIERVGPDRFVWRDMPATGQVLTATLSPGDGFAADDHATLRLPDRPPIRVALTPGVPAMVRDAVRADDGVVLADPAQAQVIVRREGETTGSALPALILSSPSAQTPAFRFAGPGENGRDNLAARLDEFGLGRLDAAALANQAWRPIAVDVTDGPRRTIAVWGDLFDPRSDFVKSATMPLFVSHGLRWLSGGDSWIPYVKAGAPVVDQSRLYGLAGRMDRGRGGPPIAASLTDRDVTTAVTDATPHPAIAALSGYAPPNLPFLLLMFGAGILLAVEWWLFQRGRMP